jgi:hypothetical protein
MGKYHNPDGSPVVDDGKRTLIVRFRNKEDMVQFSKKTGIPVNQTIKQVKYPMQNGLSSLFS